MIGRHRVLPGEGLPRLRDIAGPGQHTMECGADRRAPTWFGSPSTSQKVSRSSLRIQFTQTAARGRPAHRLAQGILSATTEFHPHGSSSSARKVHAARIIAGHDDAAVRTGAALHTGIANKHGDGRASLQVPDLEGIVAGGGDLAPPVRRRRHAKDPIGMAGERAQVQMSLVSGSTLVSC